MTRLRMLRAGFAALAVTFLAFSATLVPPLAPLLVLGLAIGFVGGFLLMFSGTEMPRWAGLSIVGYFLLTVVAFLASTGATIRIGGTNYFVNDNPSTLFGAVADNLIIGIPFVLAAAATVAAWEEEKPRWVLAAALGGFVLLAILTLAINPGDDVTEASENRLLISLFGIASLVAAAGASWVAWRPESLPDEPSEA